MNEVNICLFFHLSILHVHDFVNLYFNPWTFWIIFVNMPIVKFIYVSVWVDKCFEPKQEFASNRKEAQSKLYPCIMNYWQNAWSNSESILKLLLEMLAVSSMSSVQKVLQQLKLMLALAFQNKCAIMLFYIKRETDF